MYTITLFSKVERFQAVNILVLLAWAELLRGLTAGWGMGYFLFLANLQGGRGNVPPVPPGDAFGL